MAHLAGVSGGVSNDKGEYFVVETLSVQEIRLHLTQVFLLVRIGPLLTGGRITTRDGSYTGEWLPLPIDEEHRARLQRDEHIPDEFWTGLRHNAAPCCFRTSVGGGSDAATLGRPYAHPVQRTHLQNRF